MKKYYIIREDGSSVFEQPYCEDFIFHCLFCLLDTAPTEKFKLCHIDTAQLHPLPLSADKKLRYAAG